MDTSEQISLLYELPKAFAERFSERVMVDSKSPSRLLRIYILYSLSPTKARDTDLRFARDATGPSHSGTLFVK